MRKSGWMASMVAFFIVMGAGLAFAQAVAAPVSSTPADALGLAGLVKGLMVGSIIGFAVAFLGYMKDKTEDKKWDFKAAAPTLIWGAIVGALTGLGQKDLSSIAGFKDNAATVIIAELVGKAAFRNGAPVIGNVVSALLGRKS